MVTKQSILVVEDEENIRTLLRHFLRREGYDVKCAHDGRSAQQFLEAHKPVDLVLLDHYLPYREGFELIEVFREHPEWGQVPIMMLSVKSSEEFVARALAQGADDFVEKPFAIKKVLARIRRLVSN